MSGYVEYNKKHYGKRIDQLKHIISDMSYEENEFIKTMYVALIGGRKITPKMENSIISFLEKWIPNFSNSDRHYLTISIGCTGGLHRSVFLAEKVYKYLSLKYTNILIKHRDVK